MKQLLKITGYTIADQMRAKSFYLLLAISIGLLFLMRGCYSADYVINGQPLESVFHISRIIFQAIVMGMLLMAAMLSMRIFTRDLTDGSVQMFLSRPVKRLEYVLGRIIGTWLLVSGFMLLLHLTMGILVWKQTGSFNPGYLGAFLVCSVNLLFMIGAVCFFSLLMPDFISALFAIGLLGIGFVSDGGYRLLSNDTVSALLSSAADSSPALWRLFYPKLFMVQAYADTVISQNAFVGLGPVHPLINVLGFSGLFICLTVAIFNKKSL